MGQAAQRKKILQPLDKIKLEKIADIETALKDRFGEEKSAEITAEWDRLSREADASDNPGMQNDLYQFLNQNFDLSMIVTCYTDAAIIREFCLWLFDHKQDFGKEILDVGCGNGIISCFLAQLLQDSHITAIDRSENCIEIAKKIKEKFGVSNIDFRTASLEEMDEGGFDTVLSIRTFHENIPIRYTDYRFLSFSEQVSTYQKIYEDYCRKLCRPAAENGNLICIERNHRDTEFYAVLDLLSSIGFPITPESLKELSCAESDFKEPSIFQTLIAKRSAADEDLFSIWRRIAFSSSEDPDYFTRPQADWFMEQNGGKLIEGYATFDAGGTQLAKACLLEKINDPDHFLMYQANYGQAGIQILPYEALEEAKEVFADHKQIDSARGFIVKEL